MKRPINAATTAIALVFALAASASAGIPNTFPPNITFPDSDSGSQTKKGTEGANTN